ncbi:MFS general substrate transporter [Periconia macrospinosa]|uniref:MFS general substrate transporter n=1 Tax=Periconia macrospinosa TaxID=97972 RepID=A0A2V1E2J9_9PLEO|nr:MFS general substrate transporter [Periconia macrospinosa]
MESPDQKAQTSTDEKAEAPLAGSIDPDNEIKGMTLVIINIALILATFLTGLDFNIISTAIPTITSRFDSIKDVGWYGASFYIALCASQPLAGKTYILFSKKAVFALYLAVFEIGSIVCATAPTSRAFIAGRAVAGLGASGIFAGSLIVMTTIMPLHKRPIWQGMLNASFGVASIVGPLIGGAFTEKFSWRWCFWINLPIGGLAVAIILGMLKLKPAPAEQAPLFHKLKGLDGTGSALFAGAVTMLLLALQWGGTLYTWDSATIIGLFIGAGLIAIAFVVLEIHIGDQALIPSSIMTNRNVILLSLGALFANGPFQTIIYYLPIWFQVLGASPVQSGVRYLPTVITDVVTSFASGAFAMMTGHWKPLLLFGNAVISIGSGLLTTLHPGTSSGKWIGYQILVGMGYPLVINMGQLGVQASLPPDIVHIGSTTLLFFMSISCAICLAIGQTIFQLRLNDLLLQIVSPTTVEELLSSGARDLPSVVEPGNLAKVIQSYSSALTDVFFVPAVGPILSFIFVFFTTWVLLKNKTTEKEGHQSESAVSESQR